MNKNKVKLEEHWRSTGGCAGRQYTYHDNSIRDPYITLKQAAHKLRILYNETN